MPAPTANSGSHSTPRRMRPDIMPSRTVYDRRYVESLFDSIAHRYDLLNRVLSAGMDVRWRRRAVQALVPFAPERMLDVATGTADLALTAARMLQAQVVGIDISREMLGRAGRKVELSGLAGRITLRHGQAEDLPFEPSSFDAVTVAFGIRNFSDLQRGMSELARVLRHGGVAVILEFSRPRGVLFAPFYRLYANWILPRVGGMVSGNRGGYEYLPRTVAEFPGGADLALLFRSSGFSHVTWEELTGGICTLFVAVK